MATASTRLPLAAWYVISLRPSGGHARIRRAAGRFGATVFALSPLRIAPLPLGPQLASALAADTVIFTSVNAVKAVAARQPLQSRPGQAWLAVGRATAHALHHAGIADALVPERQDSEGLLALASLQNVSGQRIGLVTGTGGRELISTTLTTRGAALARADVYCRHPTVLPRTRLQRLATLPRRSAWLVSSEEALSLLWQALSESQQQALRARVAIASSPRLAARLAELGVHTVLIAASAAPAHLLQRLAEHAAQQALPVG